MTDRCTCNHVRIVHKDGIGICSITDCTCAAFVPAQEDPLPPQAEARIYRLNESAKTIGTLMDNSTDPLILAGLANLGNFLWFRLQQKNAKVIGEPVAERKHEDECKRYKALLPVEWQW